MHPNRLHYDYRIDREQTSQFVLFLQVFLFRFCFLYIFIHSSRSVASSLTLCVLLFAYGGVKHTGLKKKKKSGGRVSRRCLPRGKLNGDGGPAVFSPSSHAESELISRKIRLHVRISMANTAALGTSEYV